MTIQIPIDLEGILRFSKDVREQRGPYNIRIDESLSANLSVIGYQLKSIRQYRLLGQDPETFLTKPNGLTEIETVGDTTITVWKLPNRKSGTYSESFFKKNGRISYDLRRYEEAQTERNPAVDLPELLDLLERSRTVENPTDLNLFRLAYSSGLYLPGELEKVESDILKTRTIIQIRANLGKKAQRYYDVSLDGETAAQKLDQIEHKNVIDYVMDEFSKKNLIQLKRDLTYITENDPRIRMQSSAKVLLNEIKGREKGDI